MKKIKDFWCSFWTQRHNFLKSTYRKVIKLYYQNFRRWLIEGITLKTLQGVKDQKLKCLAVLDFFFFWGGQLNPVLYCLLNFTGLMRLCPMKYFSVMTIDILSGSRLFLSVSWTKFAFIATQTCSGILVSGRGAALLFKVQCVDLDVLLWEVM